MIDLRDVAVPTIRHDVTELIATSPRIDADPRPLGTVRAGLGERPVWDAAARMLIWVDVDAGQVHRWPDGDPDRALPVWTAGSPVGIAWPTRSGGVLVAAADGLRLLGPDPAPDDVDPTPDCPDPRPVLPGTLPTDQRWNDGATDALGRMWLTAMSRDDATAPGTVHRIDAAADTVAITGVTCGNGIQFSPDQRWMYVTDSVRRVLYRLPHDPRTGTLGNPEPLFALDPAGPLPDGTTVDAHGTLWVAVWGAGAVLRLAPDGRPLAAFTVPTPLVTCLEVGPDGTGWVTTAGSPDARLGDPGESSEAGAVWSVRLPGVRAAVLSPVDC